MVKGRDKKEIRKNTENVLAGPVPELPSEALLTQDAALATY